MPGSLIVPEMAAAGQEVTAASGTSRMHHESTYITGRYDVVAGRALVAGLEDDAA
jgi:hypothetical protein